MVLPEMANRWRASLLRVKNALTGSASLLAPVVFGAALLPSSTSSTLLDASSSSASAKARMQALQNSTGSAERYAPRSMLISRTTYPANDPIEDRFDYREIQENVVLASVMDGHGGWQAAEYTRKYLLETVARELENCPFRAVSPSVQGSSSLPSSFASAPPVEVGQALTRAYTRIDRAFLSAIRPAFELGFGDVAHVGCCTLTAAILPNAIVVANAGDCRAVLGRVAVNKPPVGAKADGPGAWAKSQRIDNLYYSALPLSNDHNAREESEKIRLAKEHPGENDIVVCKADNPQACYVKGRLQPTRAIGDGYLKDSEFNTPPHTSRQWGRHIKAPYTPPYVVSTPEVSITPCEPSIDGSSFVILGCDGVWDVLSNEAAVSYVSEQVQGLGGPSKASIDDLDRIAEKFKEYVLTKAAEAEGMTLDQLKSLRPGKNHNSRRNYHDDITALIVFFGKNYSSRTTKSSLKGEDYGNVETSASKWKLW